ncbi:hypothetical protein AMTRI_Chr03g139830 [Amborella trichopoda]|uniref:Uncharacterized protein n=1 Tax=Amborella trichopoda TaxID=13333 RepID=W1NTM5_AMBTC|nr:uncharacterized protein LOC18428980 [Amborella trichopoda]ERN00907.1 hypothetical protein AMTR_s00103p00149960 [Amborella trichopoda]|eukprot:XP_011621433.1 uncharacterized protein LOC18428980 [Amborella trichopoda]
MVVLNLGFPYTHPLFFLSTPLSRSTRQQQNSWRLISSGGDISGLRTKFSRNGEEEETTQSLNVEREKALEALQQLDNQIQSSLQRETRRKRSTAYIDSDRKRILREAGFGTEDVPQFSSSFLAYSVVVLLVLTIVNNVLFNIFISSPLEGKGTQSVPTKDRFLAE